MPKPADYDDYQQAAYWRLTGTPEHRLRECERLLRAAQAEVDRLHLVADHLGHTKVTIHNLYLGSFAAPPHLLDHLDAQLSAIHTRLSAMSVSLDALTEQVTAIETVADSAITLLNGISQQLKDALASNDPTAVQALSDRLAAQSQELADAITANTPAEDEPV
jgi:hypothetical protein